MLAIFAVGSSANIVLLSISFVVSRFAIRVRNGVENFLAYRSQYENMCTYSIFYFGLKKGSLWFHVSLTMAFHFFSSFFFSLLLIVAGGTLCLAMRDLWLWLWNSLNTLIFTRAHLTMRYIALFLFLLLVCTRAHWNCNQTLIWSNSSSEKNHQNSGAMIVRCVSHHPPKEIKNKMGKNNEPTSVRILSNQSAECWQELTVALLKVNCIVCWFSSRESTRYAHVRQFALCLHNSQLRLFIMHESSDQNNPQ